MSFWGEKDSTISFCEDPYKYSPYIAEYYNSLSGLVYILLGIYFRSTKLNGAVSNTLVLLGAGTFLLHSTQRWWGQWLDELSMLFLSFKVISYLRNKINKATHFLFIPLGITVYVISYNQIFIILFACCQIYIYNLIKNLKHKKKYKLTGKIYNFLYKFLLIISTIFWILDQFFCETFKQYNLHAWWHIGTALTVFFGLNELLISY